MADYRSFRERFIKAPAVATEVEKPAAAADVLARTDNALTEFQAKQVLRAFGVSVPPEFLAADADAAVAAAAEISGPVALKIQSPDILHKTEAGAVALGLNGDDAVRGAFADVMAKARIHDAKADIHGVLVQPMARPGREIILGVNRDDAFGPMVMVGLGGIHVEVMRDVAFAPAPLGPEDARALLDRLQGAALLHGVRGQPPADIDALVDLMVTVSNIADSWRDEIAEIDLNPILVHPEGQGLSIVDALIVKGKND